MTTMPKIDIKQEKFEPGAARFGSFMNYYSFNSVSKRIEVLPTDFLAQLNIKEKPILCLDIGCNSGDLTLAFYSYLISSSNTEIFMLGIDIDEILITRCKESNNYKSYITFEHINIMEENASKKLNTYLQQYDRTEFDIVTCFSTTMWIHLNYGDNGLNNFLKFTSGLTKYFIIEPQEWKCYKSAVRRMKRLNRDEFSIQQLKIKNIFEHLSKYLSLECCMHLKTCFGETSWGRIMYLFQNSKYVL